MSILKKMAAVVAAVACTFAFADTAYAGKPTGPAKPPPASTAVHTGSLTGLPSDGTNPSAVTGSVALEVHQAVVGSVPIVLANIGLPTGFTWDGGDTVVVTGDDSNTVDPASYTVDWGTSSLTIGGLNISNGDGDGTTDFTVAIASAHITASTAMTAEGTFPVSSQYRTNPTRKVKEQSWVVSTNGIITLSDGTSPSITSGASTLNEVLTSATALETYGADQSVTWSVTGTDAGLFSISSGGMLSFSGSSTPTAGTSYSVTVVATDPLGHTGTLDVTVNMAS